ncbi:MAG TPA: hypothetical protein VGV39_11645 [Mesorhizobium sp.]|jgi:hypothetical protein|uniref:DUF6894 family protein n=1 Tax=Mesorhizobium sp. TaxID=1871066 RepID=UPI002DDD36CB|nr:hypothetical protein [Mesorhizobium sp.]HEV2503723.1 hypothetical protein [Mesorhizobium sp.]
MQIVKTEVYRPTSEGGNIFRVRFCGDGEECISVEMQGHALEADEAVLARAKTLLIETASVGLAENQYDAESNGNFDEVSVTAAQTEDDAVFIFECRDGEGSRQLPSVRLSGLDAAHAEALRCAVDMLVDLEPGKDALTGWLVRVLSESGELHWIIDVQEAEAARQAADRPAVVDHSQV